MTTTDWTIAQQTHVYKKGGFAFHWLGNVDMHMYANVIRIYHVVQEF